MPIDPAWDEAFLRVESYLRAHHLESRVRLNQLATEIIREAHEWSLEHPGVEPVTAAMTVAHLRIGAWLAHAGYPGDCSDERVRVRGRLALVLADVPGRWAKYFFSSEPVPRELAEALASGVFRPGPELKFSNMPPAPLEFGFDDWDDSRVFQKVGWQVLRAAAWWLPIVGLVVVAWTASH